MKARHDVPRGNKRVHEDDEGRLKKQAGYRDRRCRDFISRCT
jgi:hypothetical protein